MTNSGDTVDVDGDDDMSSNGVAHCEGDELGLLLLLLLLLSVLFLLDATTVDDTEPIVDLFCC